ncbi:MAG: RidA family protein [Paracoccaceae bacterium]
MIKHHRLETVVAAQAPFNHIVEAGNQVFLSGILAADDLSAGEEAFVSVATETATCLRLIERMLASVSLKMTDVTSVLVHMTDLNDFDEMNTSYGAFFEKGTEPVRTCVQVAGLLENARIEITCQAHRST